MGLIVLPGLHAAHRRVKRLCLHRRMGRQIQLFSAVRTGPLRRPGKKLPPDASAPQLSRNVQARQVPVIPRFAQRGAFHRGKALERAVRKGPQHNAARGQRILQALHKKRIIRFAPVVDERRVPHDPYAVFPAAALRHFLAPFKMPEQRSVQLAGCDLAVFHIHSPSMRPPRAAQNTWNR